MHPLPMSKPPRSLSPNTAQALKTAGLVRHLGSVAEGIGVRFVVLKGAALHALRLVKADARPMCDLDVLLSPEDAARLSDTLVSHGWEARGGPCGEDHLPILKHSFWPALELHDQLSGVSLDGKSWVGFADLVNGGGVEAFPAAGPAVFVPTREFLAAHAIAHGFFHHESDAIGYQRHRVFDDLAALGVLEGTDDEFLAGPGRWMKRGLAREEILTILRLGRRLARGENVAADLPPHPGVPIARARHQERRGSPLSQGAEAPQVPAPRRHRPQPAQDVRCELLAHNLPESAAGRRHLRPSET